jgi:CRISPR-associated protein Cas5 subtype I-B
MEICLKIVAKTFSYRHPLFLTSAPSYLFPPPTSIYGLFAAILGIGKNDVKENRKLIKKEIQDKIDEIEFLIPKKVRSRSLGIIRFNADENKWRRSWFTTMTYNYVFDLELILIIKCEEELGNKLVESIKNYVSCFTPYLGSSENLIQEISLVNKNEIDLSNYIKIKKLRNLTNVERNINYLRLRLPSAYDEEGNWIYEDWVLIYKP